MYLNKKAYKLIEELSFSNFFNPFMTVARGAKNFAVDYFHDRFNEPTHINDPQITRQINKSKSELKKLEKEIKNLELKLRSPGIIDNEEKRKEIEQQLEEKRKTLKTLKNSKSSLVNFYYKNAFSEKAKKGMNLIGNAIKEYPTEAALTAGGLGAGLLGINYLLGSDLDLDDIIQKQGY